MNEISGQVKRKVCLIDDDADIVSMYRMRFEQEGYEVATAFDGQAGLKLIQETNPDVILLDLQMPVMDGVAVLDALNKNPQLMTIPVVVFSNNNTDQMFQKISELGTVRYYIVKALTTPQKVIDIVEEALTGESTRA